MLFLLSSLIADSGFLNFSAGQDLMTRIWSISSGELLHSIPIPENVDKSENPIPALYYSDAFGGRGGMPGLLQGAGEAIYFYSFWNTREPSRIFVKNQNEKKEMWFCSGTLVTGEALTRDLPCHPLSPPPQNSNKLCTNLPEICLDGFDKVLPRTIIYFFTDFLLFICNLWAVDFLPFSLRAVHHLLLFLLLFLAVPAIFVLPPQWREILLLWVSGLHPSKRSMRLVSVSGFKLSASVILCFVFIGSVCLRHVLLCSSHHFWTFKFGVLPFFAPLLVGAQSYVSINLVFLEVSVALSLIEIIVFTVTIMTV